MSEEKYNEIIIKLQSFKTNAEKKNYLKEVIEETDVDGNGFNDELINIYNKL